MSDLSTKVRAIAFEETPTGHKWAEEHLISQPPGEDLSQREEDLREWGFLYGAAYGIARGENPFESNEEAAQRAYEVANGIFHDPLYSNLELVKRFETRYPAPAKASSREG